MVLIIAFEDKYRLNKQPVSLGPATKAGSHLNDQVYVLGNACICTAISKYRV